MKYPGYFLIVADFIQWAKARGIPVGPGAVRAPARSSPGRSPSPTSIRLRFGLLFERFLNPDRVSMPDFDVDFCQERRDEVIDYVAHRYGHDRVAQIITFGTLQARAALRDVGRVLEMPYGQVDRLCKLVPADPANPVTLEKAVEGEPRFEEARKQEPVVERLLTIAMKLEGLYRHASTHAAGHRHRRPAADRAGAALPRSALRPAGHPVQHEVGGAGGAGEIRLPRPEDADRAARTRWSSVRRRGVEIDLTAIPLEDAPTFEMLARGETVGIFQVEGRACAARSSACSPTASRI